MSNFFKINRQPVENSRPVVKDPNAIYMSIRAGQEHPLANHGECVGTPLVTYVGDTEFLVSCRVCHTSERYDLPQI